MYVMIDATGDVAPLEIRNGDLKRNVSKKYLKRNVSNLFLCLRPCCSFELGDASFRVVQRTVVE
jgi:hypothetical protein